MKRYSLYKKGFSFIEGLISIVLFSILIVFSYGSLRITKNKYENMMIEMEDALLISSLYDAFNNEPNQFNHYLIEYFNCTLILEEEIDELNISTYEILSNSLIKIRLISSDNYYEVNILKNEEIIERWII